ncbi:MAG: hypothetical protein WD534_15765 [Phycisphaeraceae bacterium]
MRTLIDPPMVQWEVADLAGRHADDRTAVARRVNAHADRLGSGILPDPAGRIIATGHQAWLWHPGILAKDMAMIEACERFGASPLHLVVDQDTHEALTLELPRQADRRIEVRTVRLASHRVDLPTGAQPPADAEAIRAKLQALGDERVAPIAEAFTDLPTCRTLAEQLAVVTVRLMRPWLGDDGPSVPVLFVSDLPSLPGYAALVERMVDDARRCVRAYNVAVRAESERGDPGVAELVELRELVELPLWAVRWGRPRGRMFVDLADSEPWLVDETGERVDREAVALLPRALLLTAVMRSLACDLFIHGKGGGVYDRVMERWWKTWRGEPLASRAVVSADLRLPFADVPVADEATWARAVWFRHYVPHNVDRVLGVDGPAVQRKRGLLAQMDDDRDRKRRRRAFEQLHAINADLLDQHPDLLVEADRQLDDARQGLLNARLASRRDWSFPIYPPRCLQALRTTVAGQA